MSNDYEKLMLLCENIKLSILSLHLNVPPVDLLHPSPHFLTPSKGGIVNPLSIRFCELMGKD